MNFQEKIQEICEKPERARRKYIFSGVFLCMFFVLVIWIFSVSRDLASLMDAPGKSSPSSIGDLKEAMVESSQKIQDIGGQMKNAVENIQRGSNELLKKDVQSNQGGTQQQEFVERKDEDGLAGNAGILPVPEGELPLSQ